MDIALLTIWHVQNYGAELQSYATIKILEKLGYHVKMINIRLADCSHPNLKGKMSSFLSSFGPGYKKFNDFWTKYIPTTLRYKTIAELQRNPPKADMYIVGSDQVWNPDLTGDFAKLFFLDFGTNKIKRISYASSFGKSEWTHDEIKSDVRKLLLQFSAITCRELSGTELLKKEFSIDAKCVVDPTLLLGDYSELTKSVKESNSL